MNSNDAYVPLGKVAQVTESIREMDPADVKAVLLDVMSTGLTSNQLELLERLVVKGKPLEDAVTKPVENTMP